VEHLAEAFDQVPLPLREVLFLPLQRLPFLYQRAKRLDECIGHECLNSSLEVTIALSLYLLECAPATTHLRCAIGAGSLHVHPSGPTAIY
jgi:hypothetical protein